jgi:hypothetical protein
MIHWWACAVAVPMSTTCSCKLLCCPYMGMGLIRTRRFSTRGNNDQYQPILRHIDGWSTHVLTFMCMAHPNVLLYRQQIYMYGHALIRMGTRPRHFSTIGMSSVMCHMPMNGLQAWVLIKVKITLSFLVNSQLYCQNTWVFGTKNVLQTVVSISQQPHHTSSLIINFTTPSRFDQSLCHVQPLFQTTLIKLNKYYFFRQN